MTLTVLRIQAIVLDFDGVLTDDRVWVDQEGREMVCCSRRDGIGFDILRKTNIKLFILSTETNPVVAMRARKLKVSCVQGSTNKAGSLKSLAADQGFALKQTLFVGNDINDIDAMGLCGFSACPLDAHPEVKKMATFVLSTKGGQGIIRELVERILNIAPVEAWRNAHN